MAETEQKPEQKQERKNRDGVADIRSLVNSKTFKDQLARALPKHISQERFARVITTQLLRNPDLGKCTTESLTAKCLEAAAMGLEPDGRLAHLVPRWNSHNKCYECTLNIDYKGYVDLMFRGGFVRRIHADVVYEGDIFVYELGEVKKHVPWAWRDDRKKPETRGKVRGAFCLIELKDGAIKCEAMTEDDIQALRARSASPNKGPWVTDTDEMRKKCPFRRASKWVPMSSEYRDKIEKDDDILDVEATVVSVSESLGQESGMIVATTQVAQTVEPARIEAQPEQEVFAVPEVVAENAVMDRQQSKRATKQKPLVEESGTIL